MHAVKPNGRSDHTQTAFDEDLPIDSEGAAEASADEVYEIFRVHCPDCARPIALFVDEAVLPEHALCPTPWDPFGLTVCAGSGRPVEEAAPAGGAELADERDMAALLTLPEGLDWRTQPFSHAGGPSSRPMRAPLPSVPPRGMRPAAS